MRNAATALQRLMRGCGVVDRPKIMTLTRKRIDDGWRAHARKLNRYRPCLTGLHITFHDEEDNELVTVTNIASHDGPAARAAFTIAALKYADVEADLICDLIIDGDLMETCELWRQQIEPLKRELGVSP